MSNIIKSFRVIESNIVSKQKANTNTPLEEKFIEEAKKKYNTIILNAEKEAKKIIDSANIKSEKKIDETYERTKEILEESKIKGYNKGYQLGMEEGFNQGYEKGFDQGKKASEKLILEALDIKNDYIEQKSRLLRDVEEEVIELVISIYEKVLYTKVEEDEKLIVSLVLNGIDNLEVANKLTIIVPKENYDIVKTHKNEILAKASSVNELDIRINSDMKKGDCIIETSKGSVDVSIDNQLEEVKDLLTTILSNE